MHVKLVRRSKRKPSHWASKVTSSNGNRKSQKHLFSKSNKESSYTEEHQSNYETLAKNNLNSERQTVSTGSKISSEKKTNQHKD
ncbi:unnamed protein product [Adineta ricciae]|uniref:Uncharacterized protein n=1 Tax=Adineta ricciae TaxID=249248 RepID=A0A815TWA2_ADIRI|nr:unnamed protein product [Adineta ricciae]